MHPTHNGCCLYCILKDKINMKPLHDFWFHTYFFVIRQQLNAVESIGRFISNFNSFIVSEKEISKSSVQITSLYQPLRNCTSQCLVLFDMIMNEIFVIIIIFSSLPYSVKITCNTDVSIQHRFHPSITFAYLCKVHSGQVTRSSESKT